MILPMMGLLFMLLPTGLLGGAALALVPSTRWLAPFALVPVCAALLSFCCAWGAALVLEASISSAAGGIGFFSGYALGGIGGALGGWTLARRSARSRS